MQYYSLVLLLILSSLQLLGQKQKPEETEFWEPEPMIITAGNQSTAPSDAVILFDGSSVDAFQSWDKKDCLWTIREGIFTVKPGSGDIITKEKFGSCQFHIEFKTPNTGKTGQAGGNSGVFFQNRYEVQILNSFENKTYANGQAAAIYKQYPPLVNASRPVGDWQSYDIIFTEPAWNGNGSRKSPGYFTVFHNGVLVQNHVEIQGTTEYIGPPRNVKHGHDVIKLQDHGDEMQFRNIWLRKL